MKKMFLVTAILTAVLAGTAGAVSFTYPHDGGGSAADARFAQSNGSVLNPDYHLNLPTVSR